MIFLLEWREARLVLSVRPPGLSRQFSSCSYLSPKSCGARGSPVLGQKPLCQNAGLEETCHVLNSVRPKVDTCTPLLLPPAS